VPLVNQECTGISQKADGPAAKTILAEPRFSSSASFVGSIDAFHVLCSK
jgi:hypothetical protein